MSSGESLTINPYTAFQPLYQRYNKLRPSSITEMNYGMNSAIDIPLFEPYQQLLEYRNQFLTFKNMSAEFVRGIYTDLHIYMKTIQQKIDAYRESAGKAHVDWDNFADFDAHMEGIEMLGNNFSTVQIWVGDEGNDYQILEAPSKHPLEDKNLCAFIYRFNRNEEHELFRLVQRNAEQEHSICIQQLHGQYSSWDYTLPLPQQS